MTSKSRRERLRAIRSRLAELLASGELERIAAGRPPYKPRPESTVIGMTKYVTALLGDATALERATPEWRATESWRQRAEFIAEQLEALAAWLDA